MMAKRILLIGCALFLAVPAPAKREKNRGAAVGVEVVFRAEDRRIITQYFRAQPSGLPPGLAKRGGALPPGLEKQLRRNGRLPPGLDKRLTPFPMELERRLPALPPDTHRGIISGRAVIYSPGRSVILDMMVID